jgi:hypothetical protein
VNKPIFAVQVQELSDLTIFQVVIIWPDSPFRDTAILKDRGYDVMTCAVRGWRPNKSAPEDRAERVSEALQEINEDDIIVVHCFDNVVYMARSEREGGGGPPHQKISGWELPH